ncbi:MAG: tRNA uridine-5-carboxymethylaminomethyl(34) synthesis GTPase MnmE [Rhodospirillales bacterium]|nr:tRNA uridine-5-carboxymethylaminomethyl(34) synthesis GTPase MnmE [Rhodospirillales bacterium]
MAKPKSNRLDTIYAPATARGRSALAVIRISGPLSGDLLERLTAAKKPPERRASLRRLVDPETGEALDRALVLWFRGPASATGEDLAELHLHGGPAVLDGLLAALGRLPGVRLAEPGEFARRAFANDKLDLTQVEGLADLVAAETAGQRRQALAQAEGSLARRLAHWRETLIGIAAYVEAHLDFSEEEEIPKDILARSAARVAALTVEMAAVLAEAAAGERLRDGIACALLGAPNVGKSSLLNALAGREAAIVTDRPGTTRDPIEVALDLEGLPVTLIDTAGLNPESDDPIEREGMRRALARASACDLALILVDATCPLCPPDALAALPPERSLVVANKCDLVTGHANSEALSISVKTGFGLPSLLSALTLRARSLQGSEGCEPPLVTRARQRRALEEALSALQRSLTASLPELFAEELRLALHSIGRLSGRVDVEDILDRVFAEFCIGK